MWAGYGNNSYPGDGQILIENALHSCVMFIFLSGGLGNGFLSLVTLSLNNCKISIILNAGSLSSEHFLLWACLIEEEA